MVRKNLLQAKVMVCDRFFGYGSLVNRATQDYPGVARAQVAGWRRIWRNTRFRDLAILSVHASPGAVIDGLAAEVPGGDWAALDEREFAYRRVPVSLSAGLGAAQIYEVPAANLVQTDRPYPILLSYLDTVLQGYGLEFGAGGVAGFFATTDGWDAPVLNDRAAPIYPRATRLSPAETALVDQHLEALGVEIIRPAS